MKSLSDRSMVISLHLLHFWLLAAFCVPLHAATYYVSTSGLDSAPGTEAQPWRTIQKAANTLAPGDTALVRGGTYSEVVTVNVSGSADSPVTFAQFPGETAVIDGGSLTPPANVDTALFLLQGRSYVIIRGFELRNYKSTAVSRIPAAVFLRGACRHVEIRDCHIHDIWKTGGTVNRPGDAFGIAVYGSSTTPATNIVIDNNHIHDCKTGSSETVVLNGNVTNSEVTNNRIHDCNNIAIDFIGWEGTCPDAAQDQARDSLCRGNTVWNITSQGNQAYASGDYSADGLYADGATRIVFERNISHDNDIGIELASEHAGKSTSAITVRDNFIYNNRQGGLLLGGYASGTGNTDACIITGNTFWNNDTLQWDNGEAQIRFHTSNCILRGNIFYTGASNWLVTVPVSAANNTNNTLDYNLYYSAAGSAAARWKWNNTKRTGFAAWQTKSGQDTHSIFGDPKFVATGATPNLHLQPTSPAVNAGDPVFTPVPGELDIDDYPRIFGSAVDLGADELAPIEAWKFGKFSTAELADSAISGDAADSDADGLPTLMEYASGAEPRVPSLVQVPSATLSAGYLALTFRRVESAVDLAYLVQVSSDCMHWDDGSSYSAQSEIVANAFTIELSRASAGGITTITVRDNEPASSSKRFMRLRVQRL